MNNFEKIKALNIDEMAEHYTELSIKIHKKAFDMLNEIIGGKTPDLPKESFLEIKKYFKQWLQEESEV